MMRHLPFVLAALVAIFLVAPMAIIVPMSFSKAISFEFPPPGYWTGYYAQYFASQSWLDATANSFIIAFGSMIFTLLVALPAAFGFVRYRFRGKGALNLLMMVPIIIPAVVSALGYYGFLSCGAPRRHPRRHDHRAQRAVDPARVSGDRGGAQGLRPQSRTRRDERGRRAVAHLFLGDAAGAAARHPGGRAVRVPAFLQRGRGGDLHRRPRRFHLAEEDVRVRSRLESDPVIAVVSTLLTGAVLVGVLISLFFRQRPANAN